MLSFYKLVTPNRDRHSRGVVIGTHNCHTLYELSSYYKPPQDTTSSELQNENHGRENPSRDVILSNISFEITGSIGSRVGMWARIFSFLSIGVAGAVAVPS